MKPTRFFLRNGLIAFFCAMTLTASAERVCRNINRDWTFRFSHQVDKNSGVKVQLPHTWNAQDALSGKQDYKRGIGNYTKSLYKDYEKLSDKYDKLSEEIKLYRNEQV